MGGPVKFDACFFPQNKFDSGKEHTKITTFLALASMHALDKSFKYRKQNFREKE